LEHLAAEFDLDAIQRERVDRTMHAWPSRFSNRLIEVIQYEPADETVGTQKQEKKIAIKRVDKQPISFRTRVASVPGSMLAPQPRPGLVFATTARRINVRPRLSGRPRLSRGA
jgi:hypothetical protein